MQVTFQPIMGIHIGFELAEAEVNGEDIGYLLVDLLVLRIQFAWYRS